MTRVPRLIAVAAAAWLAAFLVEGAHARPAAPPPAQASSLPDGPGKEVVEKLCSACHGLEYLVPSRRTVRNWVETIEVMKSFGAEATDEQWKTITDYIVDGLAYLNANKGGSDEFVRLFHIDEKAAEAVVAYREQQSGFKTPDDLKKAPGLDPARIDALQDRLIFE
jgi:DNA uptake protein ComE-like DNA-binding protein